MNENECIFHCISVVTSLFNVNVENFGPQFSCSIASGISCLMWESCETGSQALALCEEQLAQWQEKAQENVAQLKRMTKERWSTDRPP